MHGKDFKGEPCPESKGHSGKRGVDCDDVRKAGQGVGTVNVHGTRTTDAYSEMRKWDRGEGGEVRTAEE